MGNWLKGRVLIIPDNTTQQDGQVATNATHVHNQHHPHHHQHHHHHHYHSSHQNYRPDLSSQPIYYSPLVHLASEEEQIQLAKRIGLIQHLPTGIYDESSKGSTKTLQECVICMVEFSKGDIIRFLPCLHTYHVHCIDDWLMRSFICPSCMEPVDVALLESL